ncbi:hypothetical protein RIR_jg32172.t1 [Rhizophagus irregularis DAOM 181602=DAOM 197198]|nr:hypothetical protein RIR_jg32172.t1 [Rhizophagus irregularis DAOM 181602=DAOM 197198]
MHSEYLSYWTIQGSPFLSSIIEHGWKLTKVPKQNNRSSTKRLLLLLHIGLDSAELTHVSDRHDEAIIIRNAPRLDELSMVVFGPISANYKSLGSLLISSMKRSYSVDHPISPFQSACHEGVGNLMDISLFDTY